MIMIDRVETASDRIRNNHSQNGVIQPLLTDMYQINMAYAYWKSGKHDDTAVFDLFFRKNPFHGEFTIFAGLEECLKFLESFRYSESDIQYLKETMPESVEPEFFDYLSSITTKDVKVYAIDEGKVVFPRVPLLVLDGPLIVIQLLETTMLTLVNYASLVATNAARYRMAAGRKIKLLEFGLRRAQGPDGGLTASKYAYVGGFDGTSNVLAGKLYGIPVKGTHAHSYVSSYSSLDELHTQTLNHKETGAVMNLKDVSLAWRSLLADKLNILQSESSDGELAAFISFAIAFPSGFIALIDTYDVLKFELDWFEHLSIVASNDINEETIISLNEQGHKIDCFGIGTHLVTCQRQPALGCVFKLVEINGEAKIKLSQDVEKVTCPGKKAVYRLYGADGHALIDLMHRTSESAPKCGSRVLCRHPFQESKRAYVSPAKVEALFKLYWKDGKIQQDLPNLEEIRDRVTESLQTLRQDHKRNLNPTPYKVGVTDELYNFLHDLWLQNAPIGELF
ncbi:nicotinate phosphoribosyltransferase isoform X2 [Cherax quadricarinatus]|uniref:nicotinate phosphoribosyltransferase isoform X2 n=1 Tax=Cherax quadricarinatus TaxID=27406 RepID=UPI00387E3EC8